MPQRACMEAEPAGRVEEFAATASKFRGPTQVVAHMDCNAVAIAEIHHGSGDGGDEGIAIGWHGNILLLSWSVAVIVGRRPAEVL
jgi:predicted NBD/HSP70 family sugar kinase